MDELVLTQRQRDELRQFMNDELVSLKSEIANLEIMTQPVYRTARLAV